MTTQAGKKEVGLVFFRAWFRVVFLVIISLGTWVSSAQSNAIKVKFDPDFAAQLETSVKRQSVDGLVKFGIRPLDSLNEVFKVMQMERLFPYNEKFDKRHRKHGLQLWYKLTTSDPQLSARQCARIYEDCGFVLKAEIFLEKKHNDGFTHLSRNIFTATGEDIGPARVSSFDDPQLPNQWHYDNTGQTGGSPGADTDLLSAWDIQTGDPNVVVAVIDGGIDVSHEDLSDAMWVNTAEQLGTTGVDDDGNGYVDDVYGYSFGDNSGTIPADDHGTHVGGTVGAVNNNGTGVSGVAGGDGSGNGVRLMSCAAFGAFGTGGFDAAFVYAADNGAVIAQNSWGYTSPGAYEQSVLDAIGYFIANAGFDEFGNPVGPMQGGLVVFAAGNSNSSADYYPGYYESVLAVASTDHRDIRSSFSNYGGWVDIAAPGSSVLSSFPGNTYGSISGTSMACPHVSGAAALIVSEFGGMGLTPAEVWGRLVGTTDDIDPLNPGFEGDLGSGRLNAFNALQTDSGIPPSDIIDLTATSITGFSVDLSWTAPGANADSGVASRYDLRYARFPIDLANFATAAQVTSVPSPGTAGTTQSATVVGLDPLTTYYFAMKTINFFGNTSGLSNTLSVTTLDIPEIGIDPDSLLAVLDQGSDTTLVITISNDGNEVLEFDFPDFSSSPDLNDNKTSFIDFSYGSFSKDEEDTRHGHPVLQGRGEDGGFGYSWIDSNHPGGPAFSWMDISSTGTPVYLSDDDRELVKLGFDFPFYDETKSSVYISSNGFLSFGSAGAINYVNQQIPTTSAPNDIIAPFWDDLYPSSGQVHYLKEEDKFTVQFTGVGFYGNSSVDNTFQVVLREDGVIEFFYLDMTDRASATVGIESFDGTEGMQVAFNTAYIADSLAIRISSLPDFISQILPSSGSIPAGDSKDVLVSFQADSIDAGNYERTITLSSNDPTNPSITIPVILHVNGVPNIAVSDTLLDFGDNFLSSRDSLELRLSNVGSETLIISDIAGTDLPFSIESLAYPITFLPKESRSIQIYFQSDAPGAFTDSLRIVSNDRQDSVRIIALTGNSLEPPTMELSPTSIAEDLLTGDSVTAFVTIANTTTAGASDLTFHVGVEAVTTTANRSAQSTSQVYNKLRELPKGKKFVKNRLLIKLKNSVSRSVVLDLKTRFNARTLHRYRYTDTELWSISDMTVEEAIQSVYEDDNVLYAEPDYEVQAIDIPDDPSFSSLWGMHNTGQTGGTADADIDAMEAWDLSTDSRNIVVGIIDTGIDYNHEDLSNNIWVNDDEIPDNGLDDDGNGYVDDVYGWDFVYDDNDPMDGHNHGTHVAGTVGAEGDNGIGVAGVTWNVQLMALKFLNDGGSGSTSDAIEAIEYAIANGANLTNNSWGGGGRSRALRDVILAAHEANQLFVAAAGNSGDDNDFSPHYPSSYNVRNIISVAATDHNDQLADFSNYGATTVDLAAPGVSVLSSVPGNGYSSFNGTSMASPHVAGAIALAWGQSPYLSNMEIKELLFETVDPIAAVASNTVTGGRLNVHELVRNTQGWVRLETTSGVVPPDSAYQVDVLLNADGLIGDTYEVNLVITSNDPFASHEVVPVQLRVTDAPDVELGADSINFGVQFTGTLATRTLSVANDGTEDLEILKFIFSNSVFSVDTASLTLEPGQEFELPISFNPLVAAAEEGLMTIVTNDFDKDTLFVRLYGEGVAPPVIAVSPDSLGEALHTGEVATKFLTIDNSAGGSDLIWAIETNPRATKTSNLYNAYDKKSRTTVNADEHNSGKGRVGPIPMDIINQLSGETRILSWTRFTDLSREYPNTLNAISQYFTDYTVTTTRTKNPEVLRDQLADADVFLIPEQEGGSNSLFRSLGKSWAEVLKVFVQGGGILLQCGSSSSAHQILNKSGLLTVSYHGWAPKGMMMVEDTTHALTSGLSSLIPSQYFMYVLDLEDSEATQLVSHDDHTAVAIKEVGLGSVIYVGYDFYDYDDNAAMIISNAVTYLGNRLGWLVVDQTTDTLAAGSTQDIEVNLDAAGLFGGVYEATLTVSSNDPVNSSVQVPVALEVTAAPDIIVSQDSLDFGIQFVGAQVTKTLTVSNEGTDSLGVTDVAIDNLDFEADTTAFGLKPGESLEVKLTYSPAAVEVDDIELFFVSNDRDEDSLLVRLLAEAVAPPVIVVTPDSIDEALFTGETSTQLFTIDNSAGGSDLIWTIETNPRSTTTSNLYNAYDGAKSRTTVDADEHNSGKGRVSPIPMDIINQLSGETRILSWTTYADFSREYPNTLNAISQYFTDYTVTTTTTSDPDVLKDQLADVDVFLIPEQEGGSASIFRSLGSSWSEVLTDFVEGGGTVLQCGSYSGAHQILNKSGLLTLSYQGGEYGGMMMVEDTSHAVTSGLGSLIPVQNATYLLVLEDSEAKQLVSYDGHTAVAFKELGLGSVIYIGYDFYDYDDNAAIIISNAVTYGNRPFNWLTVDQTADTLAAGGTQGIAVDFDASGLFGGVYEAVLTVSSNDPINPIVKVPVTLEVTGVPDISFDKTRIDFQNELVGGLLVDSVRIINEGTDVLVISDIQTNNTAYVVNQTTMEIAAFDAEFLVISYSPSENNVDGLLTIFSNDEDESSVTVELNVDDVDPSITSLPASTFEENGTETAYLPTADEEVVFSLGEGADEALFSTNNLGHISFTTPPDYEDPQDLNMDNGYEITVIATDIIGNSSTLDVTITVSDLDEIPPTITSADAATLVENTGGVVYSASADEAVVFSLGSAKDEALFELSNGTDIGFLSAPDFEDPRDADGDNHYELDIIATDLAGNSSSLEIIITVLNLDDDAPIITSESEVEFVENGTAIAYHATADEQVTFALGNDKDEALFQFISDDKIKFIDAPDFENPLDADGDNAYELDIFATDDAGNDSMLEVIIIVMDEDEKEPTFTSPSFVSFDENGVDMAYKIKTDEVASFALGADKDEPLFYLSNGNKIYFVTAPDFEDPQDSDGDNVYLLDVFAVDTAGNTSAMELAIEVSDLLDNGPAITSPDITYFSENSTDVAYVATASEPAIFSLGTSNDESLFVLAADGEVSFLVPPNFEEPLDADGDNRYVIEVLAADLLQNFSSLEVVIEVTNVRESLISGDLNDDGIIGEDEIAGDVNMDGIIGIGEIAGDVDGDGTIGVGEIAGDINGDGVINRDEEGRIDGIVEIAGDIDGDGTINGDEIAGDVNGDLQIGDDEIAGDADGDRSIDDTEMVGDIDGDGSIGAGEMEGDTNGDGFLNEEDQAVLSVEHLVDIRLFPNPVRTILHIDMGAEQSAMPVQVVNMSGQVLIDVTLDRHQGAIDVQALKAGIYLLQATVDGEVMAWRFSKQ